MTRLPPRRTAGRGRWASRGGRWGTFADGCGTAKWGALVEYIAIGYLFFMIELACLAAAGVVKLGRMGSDTGPLLLAPFLLPLLIGTAMMGIGRLRMAEAPPDAGVGGCSAGRRG